MEITNKLRAYHALANVRHGIRLVNIRIIYVCIYSMSKRMKLDITRFFVLAFCCLWLPRVGASTNFNHARVAGADNALRLAFCQNRLNTRACVCMCECACVYVCVLVRPGLLCQTSDAPPPVCVCVHFLRENLTFCFFRLCFFFRA